MAKSCHHNTVFNESDDSFEFLKMNLFSETTLTVLNLDQIKFINRSG